MVFSQAETVLTKFELSLNFNDKYNFSLESEILDSTKVTIKVIYPAVTIENLKLKHEKFSNLELLIFLKSFVALI